MIISKISIYKSAAIVMSIIFMAAYYGCGLKKTVEAGAAWEVTETTSLNKLVIHAGASITAPEGYSVTLTVDGIKKPIKAGEYDGKIILTVIKS